MADIRYLLALVLAAGAGTVPALGETHAPKPAPMPVVQEGAALHFDAAGHRVTIPLPDWLSAAQRLSADIVSLVEANYYSDATQAFVEFFPQGESLENWNITYAARVTLQPGRSLEDYRRATIFGYSRTCKPEATGVFTFGEDAPDFFPALGFICGAYLDSIPALRGMGEVMVSVFRKTETGIAVIYQEWRGPAFETYDPASWPVSAEGLEARATELQADAVLLARPDDG